MASFTIRMVLHKATWDDYTQLATEMAREGFGDIITADDGKRYRMPDAEYTGTAVDRATALNKAAAAATRVVGSRFAVLVTESAGRTWQGLEEV
ncbi:hypothetical protein [Variovorax ginsengisoli]|uniref:DUF2622 domain-containing protein n=1 Tax=Variovorax ginsengisoli TaxID=363844 RepID=A0ABT8SF57_9BURK|nr:hypothetical protein [Variovorax ginsengisoli]MDN8618333.1 hypothetical protein [Variovorax ginsengisoli]MDO1537503.1 hypothetical protein [Variovorax ginsengisoli]